MVGLWLSEIQRWDWCLKMMVNVHGFKGKSTGNHRFSYDILAFPVILPLNQSVDNCHCVPIFSSSRIASLGGCPPCSSNDMGLGYIP